MRPLLTAVLLLLVLPAVAVADGITAAKACGIDHCVMLERPDAALEPSGDDMAAPRRGAAHHVLRLWAEEPVPPLQPMWVTYVPSLRAVRLCDLRGEPYWMRLDAAAARAYARGVEGLAPLRPKMLGLG